MSWLYIFLCLHLLGATIWVGGHIVVATRILPEALKNGDSSILLDFEKRYEKLGMPALVVQVLTGLWLAWKLLGPLPNWFDDTGVAHAVQLKLLLLVLTLLLAFHAKTRVIPKISDRSLKALAWHIRAVTIAAVLLVLVGVSIRFGGI